MMASSSISATTTWGSTISNNNNNRRPSVAKKASAAAVDAYAQGILESASTIGAGHEPDDSLGSYVTSLIRSHGNEEEEDNNTRSVRDLPEFESLVELIQEHCSISPEQAQEVLEQIARAVQTGEIPYIGGSTSNNSSTTGARTAQQQQQQQKQQHHYTTEDLIQSMNLLSAATSAVEAEKSLNNNNKNFVQLPLLGTSSSTASSTTATRTPESDGGDTDLTAGPPPPLTMQMSPGENSIGARSIISPIHADNLIPVDLLGVLDDPSTPKAEAGGRTIRNVLSASAATPMPPPPTNSSSSQKKLTSQEERQRLANDIAASLFQPTTITRSRQSSIDESNSNKIYTSTSAANTTSVTTSPNNLSPNNLSPNLHAVTPGAGSGGSGSNSNLYDHADSMMYYDHQQHQEWNAIMDMLLTMNPEISEEAASAAAYMSSSFLMAQQQQHHNSHNHYYDVNVAQYLIDCAMSTPPICRHLLNDGCYRSDCTYSHDIDGHVCIFWIRGRCGKGDSCRFLHGFDENKLNDIDPLLLQQEENNNNMTTYIDDGEDQHHKSSIMYNDHDHDDDYGSSAGGYGLPTPVAAAVSFYPPASSAWRSEAPGLRSSTTTTTSFANIASQGYQTAASFTPSPAFASAPAAAATTTATNSAMMSSISSTRKVDIPQDLWNAHENRDSSVFYIANPIERYHAVSASSSTTARQQQQRDNVIDLHFQSTKTFGVVLETILPTKLERYLVQQQDYYHHKKDGTSSSPPAGIWIVTGTGHHVGSKTHQKGGGALEQAVMEWLIEHGYDFLRGRDRNGQGGAVLVTSKRKYI